MSLGDLVAHADQFLTSKVAKSRGAKVGDLAGQKLVSMGDKVAK